MRILAFELSTACGSLAWRDNDVDLLREWPNNRKNSGAFFQNLAEVQKQFGAPEKIVVGLGPGSYAGTRIAISAAIGLQVASGADLAGLASVCAINCENNEYCVVGDARRQTFFFARICRRDLVAGPELLGEMELRDKIDKLDQEMPIFASDELPQFARVQTRYPSAFILAQLARDANRHFVLPPLEPMYLREPHITAPRST